MRNFNSNQDLYEFVLELAETARQNNHHSEAEALMDAFNAGMTASDQLGEIREVLRTCKSIFKNDVYPVHYSKEIESVLKKLNRAFRS